MTNPSESGTPTPRTDEMYPGLTAALAKKKHLEAAAVEALDMIEILEAELSAARSTLAEKEREGWKLLKDSTFDERSFHEDAPLENGVYYNDCMNCGRSFTGYKRRTLCKVCAAPRKREL